MRQVLAETGMIIVFEGVDGAGKGTQSARLSTYLTSTGVKNSLFSFPNYTGTVFGAEVGKYLNGFYGSLNDLPAQFPAMLYAMDRFEMKKNILSTIKENKTIIFDRYVPSNCAHQAAKLPENERSHFIDWVKRMEYNILELPIPDITIFLDVPPNAAGEYVLKKAKRSYTDSKNDIHEANFSYLEKVYDVYKTMAHKGEWLVIKCMDGRKMRTEDEISSDIIKALKGYL